MRPLSLLIRPLATALVLVLATSAHAGAVRSNAWYSGGFAVAPSDSQQVTPAIASDGTGGAYAIWTDDRNSFSYEPGSGIYSQHTNGIALPAQGWPALGEPLYSGASGQVALSDGAGGVFLVTGGWDWYGSVRIQHVGPDGQAVAPWPAAGVRIWITSGWGPNAARPMDPNDVQGAGPGDVMPSIALNGTGGLLVSWTHVSRFAEVVHVLKLSSDGAISTGWPWNGAIVSPENLLLQYQSCVCPDGAGGALVAYANEAGGMLASHVLSNGTVDPRWPGGGLSIADPGASCSAPGIVFDERGGFFVAWQLTDAAGVSHPMIQHLLANGTVVPGWEPHGRALATEPTEPGSFRTYQGSSFAYSSIVSDGSGGVLFAWAQGVPGSRQIYAQRVLSQSTGGSSGPKRYGVSIAGGWGEDAVHVAPSASDEGLPTIVADGSGGAFLGWQSVSPSGENQIFAQRLDEHGAPAPGWPEEGVLLAAGTGVRQHPVVAADGQGGAIVAWEDSRSGVPNIFMASARPSVTAVSPMNPAVGFSLGGFRPNPSPAGALRVAFELASSSPATLELVDLAGRRILSTAVGALGAGAHIVSLDASRRLDAGVYWLRLRQDGRELTKRGAIIR